MTRTAVSGRQFIAVTDDLPANAAWLAAAETVHRTLRPNIPNLYLDYMKRVFSEGAEMVVCVENDGVRALAVYRCYHNTFHGRRFYVDDLVTEEAKRGTGLGSEILQWCEARARLLNCDFFELESGVQRTQAHKFYFRNGRGIFQFGFAKLLRK